MAMTSTTTMAMATAVKRSIWLKNVFGTAAGTRQASARRDDLTLVEAARLIIPAKTLIGWSICFRHIFAKNVSVKESGISPDRAEYRSTF